MSLELSVDTYRRLGRLVHDRFRVILNEGQRPAAAARLRRHVQGLGYTTFEDYLDFVESEREGRAAGCLVDWLSRTGSFTCRGVAEEVSLSPWLPTLEPVAVRACRRLRFWVPGCAEGEEPWMLAIRLTERYGLTAPLRVSILATDSSARALSVALEGVYGTEAIQGLGASRRRAFFDQVGTEAWRVKDALRSLVVFRRLGLEDNTAPLGPMDTIVCRDLLHYLDPPSRARLVRRFHAALAPGGCLLAGETEGISGSGLFGRAQASVFVRLEASGLNG